MLWQKSKKWSIIIGILWYKANWSNASFASKRYALNFCKKRTWDENYFQECLRFIRVFIRLSFSYKSQNKYNNYYISKHINFAILSNKYVVCKILFVLVYILILIILRSNVSHRELYTLYTYTLYFIFFDFIFI